MGITTTYLYRKNITSNVSTLILLTVKAFEKNNSREHKSYNGYPYNYRREINTLSATKINNEAYV